MQFDLLAIGEVMAEIRNGPSEDFSVGFAGDTYNTAVYCARALKVPGSVGFKTAIGRDSLSSGFIDVAKRERLDTSEISVSPDRNIGIYAVTTDETGERSFYYWRSNSAARAMFDDQAVSQRLARAGITYLSGITLAILPAVARRSLMDALRNLTQCGKSLIAFDSNYRPQLWENADTARSCINEMWEIADIALPSIDDELALFNEASEDAVISRFASKAWTACAIKRGARGPVSPALGLHPQFQPAAKVVDTTAAGDSFNGGYLAAYIQGKSEENCLLAGHQLASKVVSVSGAIAP